jgi:hypothetical protein
VGSVLVVVVQPAGVASVEPGGAFGAGCGSRARASTSSRSFICRPVGVRRVPVPSGDDHGRGPLIPATRAVRTRHRGQHVTICRWVQRTPLFADAPARHGTGIGTDDTYVKARRFLTRALRYGPAPVEVTADKAGRHLRVVDELAPAAAHVTAPYGNNRIEADQSRLKARLRPMRGLHRFDRPPRSPPATRSSRTSAAATTNSPRRLTAAPPGGSIQQAAPRHLTCAIQRRRLPRHARRNRPLRPRRCWWRIPRQAGNSASTSGQVTRLARQSPSADARSAAVRQTWSALAGRQGQTTIRSDAATRSAG